MIYTVANNSKSCVISHRKMSSCFYSHTVRLLFLPGIYMGYLLLMDPEMWCLCMFVQWPLRSIPKSPRSIKMLLTVCKKSWWLTFEYKDLNFFIFMLCLFNELCFLIFCVTPVQVSYVWKECVLLHSWVYLWVIMRYRWRGTRGWASMFMITPVMFLVWCDLVVHLRVWSCFKWLIVKEEEESVKTEGK